MSVEETLAPEEAPGLVILLQGLAARPADFVSALAARSYLVALVGSVTEARDSMREDLPTLLLVNATPEESLDYCRAIAQEPAFAGRPLLAMIPLAMASTAELYQAGASDVIRQPCSAEELLARTAVHLRAAQRADRRGTQPLAVQTELAEERSVKDVLLRAIAHDIRSPLTSIVATLSFLQEDLGDRLPDENAEDVRQARIAASRLTELSRVVLDLARLSTGETRVPKTKVALGSLVDAVREACGQEALARVRFSADEPEADVFCDEALLRRVLLTLVRSAEKHAPPGTAIQVRSRVTEGNVRFEVEDEGPGLSERDQSLMFERYGPLKLKLRGVGRSAGIGLEFCRVAMQALGGTIGVTSLGRTGACAWIELPGAG